MFGVQLLIQYQSAMGGCPRPTSNRGWLEGFHAAIAESGDAGPQHPTASSLAASSLAASSLTASSCAAASCAASSNHTSTNHTTEPAPLFIHDNGRHDQFELTDL